MEIVPDTAVDQHAIHILQTFLVGDIVPQCMRVNYLTRITLADKLLIGELHQDNQTLPFSCELTKHSNFLTSGACPMGRLTEDTLSHNGTTLFAQGLGVSI